MGWKTFNDRFVLLVYITIIALWVSNKWIHLNPEIVGATIVAFTLIIQFYFRKSKDEDSNH